ncbi:MAG: extracellular solute-binding protein [Oscillospiraceae bacterium]|nr:extracellular solute-binding protein [Oscillospiraceae bacterium]
MKHGKRLLSLILVAMLVLGMAACGGEKTASSAPVEAGAVENTPEAPKESAVEVPEMPEEPASAEESIEEPAVQRPVVSYPLFDDVTTFTLWTSNSPDLSEIISDLNEYLVFSQLEQATNVRWDATLVSFFSSDEQFQLMVASQDYTDVVCRAIDSYTGGTDQAIEEEFLIDVSDLIDENMPNLLDWFDKYPELRKQMTTVEGNIGGFPKFYQEPSDVNEGALIRLDWLEELGLESPKTYDDLHNVLTQFKEQKNASAPLVIPVNTGVQGNLLYGYNIDNYYQVDGQVRFGPMQPEFKEYLTMMNQWYNEGLLSDSFLTSQAEVLMDFSTILSGDTGVWCGSGTQSITQLLSMAAESQPDMRITGMTNVTKDGDTAHVGTESQILDSIMWSITTQCSDPAAIARYVDYLYSDAGILLANYGVEGETFHYVDGKPVLTELVTNNPDYSYNLALNIFTCDRQTPVPFIIDEQKARNDYSEDQSNAVAVWNEATDGLYNIPRQGVNMTTKEQEEYNSIYSDIDTYMDETISKFVVGDLSLDQFDSFVQKLKDMGIEDCIAIEQTAYNRYLEA